MTQAADQHLSAWIFGSISFLFLLWAFMFGPEKLPPQKHLILGLIAAIAAGFFGYFFTGSIGIEASPDLPHVGKLFIKAAGGAALFVLVLFWWNSDRSPVKKK